MKRLVVLSAMLVWSITSCSFAASIVVGNAGFETVVPINGFPITDYGVWAGNPGDMVTAENGITPLEGSHMLRFTGNSTTTNIWNLVDVSSLPSGSTVTLSAAFNRLAGSPARMEIRISALNHAPPSNGNPELDETQIAILQQYVPDNTWTTLSLSATLPAGTQTVGLEVAAFQGFGAYADDAQLTTPEPSSVVLGVFGVVGLIAWGLRRGNQPAF